MIKLLFIYKDDEYSINAAYSAARREDYHTLQSAISVEPMHNFQKHTEVRWLRLGPSVRRILEQWDCICSFLKDLDLKDIPFVYCFRYCLAYSHLSKANLPLVLEKLERKTKPGYKNLLLISNRVP